MNGMTAGLYAGSGGVMAAGQAFFENMYYGFDAQNLYLAFQPTDGYQFPSKPTQVEIYLKRTRGRSSGEFLQGGQPAGFPGESDGGRRLDGAEI